MSTEATTGEKVTLDQLQQKCNNSLGEVSKLRDTLAKSQSELLAAQEKALSEVTALANVMRQALEEKVQSENALRERLAKFEGGASTSPK